MFAKGGPTFFELARQALSSTDAGYDRLAPKFDLTPFRTPDGVTHALRPVFDEAPVATAIDLCTGTGAGAEALGWVATERVVGIDRSAGMLAQAKAKLYRPGARGARFEFEVGDVLAPIDDGTAASRFDLATCFGAFGHIEEDDEARFVRQVWERLRPQGRFVFVTAEPPPKFSSANLFARSFNAAMHIRNAIVTPPFVMFYLTFLLPRAKALLEAQGFDVDVRRNFFSSWPQLVTVVATKPAERP